MISLIGKTLIFGDLHIGIKGDIPARLNLSIKTIDEILKLVTVEKVSNIIFLGDWFNSREYIHTTTLTIGYELAATLAKVCHVMIIAGNHDVAANSYHGISPLYTFANLDNVDVIHSITEFRLNGKLCLAVPWGYSDYETTKSYDYIFGHLNVASSSIRYNKVIGDITDNSSYTSSALNDVRTFAKKLKPNGICFSGHIHIRTEHQYRSNKIIFVGSPLELTFGETHVSHGVYILDTDHNKAKFHEITDIPKHVIMQFSDCLTEDNELKPTAYFQKFNNMIIKKVIDVNLTSEQQAKLTDILHDVVVYDFVESEICYNVIDSSTDELTDGSIKVERLTLLSYINIVFDSLNDDIFTSANTTKDDLIAIFKTYVDSADYLQN